MDTDILKKDFLLAVAMTLVPFVVSEFQAGEWKMGLILTGVSIVVFLIRIGVKIIEKEKLEEKIKK